MSRCKVKIEDGRVTVGRHDLKELVRNRKDGYASVQIKDWDRTISQNNTMWMWISIIAKELGYEDKDELYDALVDKYSWTYTYKDLDGNTKEKKLTTSKMDVSEMSQFMEHIVQFASEWDIRLPMPDERYEDPMLQKIEEQFA